MSPPNDNTSPLAPASIRLIPPSRAGGLVGCAVIIVALIFLWSGYQVVTSGQREIPPGRAKVVFWHFWGGAERDKVREIVRRFNESQDQYWVEEVPIPGQNLDMKFFMSVAGGDAPDVVNQDDQVIAEWAHRGVLTPLRELTADEEEYQRLQHWLNPAARRIGTYRGELYALCNALDIRALVYRDDALPGSQPPRTISELDALAKVDTSDESRLVYLPEGISYLPDDRRLWAWGIVFGGDFYDEETGKVTANDPRIVAALEWMVSYTKFHGLDKVRVFRSTNREVGAGSMILEGRYGMMMDGQWRVPELDASSLAGKYGVAPLPYPDNGFGRPNAGWVNGNFFIVPRNCNNPKGAWAFMKFWSGFDGNEQPAAISAASGGWIPASPQVVEQPAFQEFLNEHPEFRLFVELARSENQIPTPPIPVQAYYFDRLNQATEEAMSLSKSPQQALDEATRDVQARLDALLQHTPEPVQVRP